MIISVGYRVNSKRGSEFRKWATKVLKDHLIKVYSVNEKRLKYLEKTVQLIDIASRIEDEITVAKFGTVQNEGNRTVANRHINNLFRDGELEKKRGMCKICTYHYIMNFLIKE